MNKSVELSKCRTIEPLDPRYALLVTYLKQTVLLPVQQYFSDGFVEIQRRRQHLTKTETNLNRKTGHKRNFVEGKQRTKEIEIDN